MGKGPSCSAYLLSGHSRVAQGFLAYYTSVMMIRALQEYSHGTIECLMMGVDPDRFLFEMKFTHRETAIIAAKRNAFVITNDSDYFIFPVPGVIHLSTLLNGYKTESCLLAAPSP